MPDAFKDAMDRILNWSGGSYVGLATLTAIGLAIAEFVSGKPSYILGPDGKNQIWVIHEAPTWFVGMAGVYMAILGLFWLGRPINTYIAQKGTKPTDPAPAPEERPLEK